MEKSDFRVMVRRVPGYEPTVSLRFEMREGYGELHVGERRRASPSALGEVAEVGGEAVRGGRFVHVLASGRRRQSYAFSRLDDDRLQRLPDDKWIELTPVTEFGIRYLDLPELEAPGPVVAVKVGDAAPGASKSAPASAASVSAGPAKTERPSTDDSDSLLSRVRRGAKGNTGSASPAPPRAGSASPATARASTPASASTRARSATPEVTTRSPPPPRTAGPADGSTARQATPTAAPAPRGLNVSESIGRDAVSKLDAPKLREHLLAEMTKVEALHQAVQELQSRLHASQEREQDLVALIGRWSQRG